MYLFIIYLLQRSYLHRIGVRPAYSARPDTQQTPKCGSKSFLSMGIGQFTICCSHVMYRVYHLQCLSVEILTCLVFVCQGSVLSSAYLSRKKDVNKPQTLKRQLCLISTPIFVLSKFCLVQCLSVDGLSRLVFVKGLSCLVFVCLRIMIAPQKHI